MGSAANIRRRGRLPPFGSFDRYAREEESSSVTNQSLTVGQEGECDGQRFVRLLVIWLVGWQIGWLRMFDLTVFGYWKFVFLDPSSL